MYPGKRVLLLLSLWGVTVFAGCSGEPATVYVPGDDFRHIDWNIYARTNKFFIRRFEEERNLIVHILLDSSASMDYGKDITKFEYSAMVGLGFTHMAMKNNEKFTFATL